MISAVHNISVWRISFEPFIGALHATRYQLAESFHCCRILANSKPCPKCKRPIEKNQGCMHMTCNPPCKCCVLVNGQIMERGLAGFMLAIIMSQQSKKERMMNLNAEDRCQRTL